MKEFTFRLKADTGYLTKQFEEAASELAKMAAEAGKTEKKLEKFQEANAYLIQMEKMLDKIQKKYPDLFPQIFDGVDKQVKNALAPFRQMPEIIGQALDKVGSQMQDILSGKNKDAIASEVKSMAKSIKQAADMLDIKVDFSFLDEAKSSKAKVEDLVSVLKQLREAYQTTATVAERANLAPIVPEIKEKKKRGRKKAEVPEDVGEYVAGTSGSNASSGRSSKPKASDTIPKDVLNSIKDLKKKMEFANDLGSIESFQELDDAFDLLGKKLNMNEDQIIQLSRELEDFEGTLEELVIKVKEFAGLDIFPNDNKSSSVIDNISDDIDSTISKTKVLEDSINEIVRNASKHQLEFSVVLNGEDVAVRKGKDKTTTDIVETVGNMMSSLGKYFVDSHTHTTTSKVTNNADLKSFARLKKYGVTNHNAIFGPDGVSAYDFSQVSDEDMQKAIQMVEELGKSGNVTNEQLVNIFKTLNDGYDVVKHFDSDNIGEFAKYIDDVTRNAQTSIDPLKQFKGIVDYLAGGRVDWSKHSKLLEEFQPENAKNIFDQIVRTQTDGNIDVYNFDKKSFADIITELYDANTIGQQLTGTLNDIKQKSNDTSSSIENLGDEIDEALTQETGDLESKLERLKDIAEEYGQNITRRDRNTLESLIDQDNEKELTGARADRLFDLQEKIDAADEALVAFEEQYDKIILKLENGKKVEILPNDKGLRDLYKFMDEGDGESFGGIGVEDVEFIRKVTAEAESAMQQFQDVWKLKNDLQHDLAYKPDYLYDTAATEGAKQQIAEYDEELKRLATSYVGLSGSIDDFKSKEKRAFAEDVISNLNEQAENQLEETNQKIKEQEDLYQQVRTAIKGTLEEVVGMDYTAVALEDIEREIKDGLITTLEEAIIRFKEMNNIADDVRIAVVGEYQRVADSWDYYQGNRYVDEDNETVVNKNEYESLKQKTSTEDIGQEYKDLETLRQKVAEVEKAIIDKTSAFHQEADAVDVDVKSEIDQIEKLHKKLEDIKLAVDNKTNAFEAGKNIVTSSVTNELTELNKLKDKLDAIAGQVKAIGKISIVDQPKEKKPKEKKSKPLDDTPIKGEQLGMDLDAAVQDTKELEVAEKQVEDAVEQTNAAIDEQITKGKELIEQKGTLNFLSKELKKTEKFNGSWNDATKEEYEQLIVLIGEYGKSNRKLTAEEIESIRKRVDNYKHLANIEKQRQENAEKTVKIFGSKELNKATDSKNNLEALGRGFNSKSITDGLESVRNAYMSLVEAQRKFNDGHDPTDEERVAYKKLINDYNQAAKALDDLFKTSKKMSDNSRWSVEIDQSELDNLEKSMQNAIQASENGRVKFGRFSAETGQLEYSVRRANGTWDHFTAQVDEAGMAVVGLNGKMKTTNGIVREFTTGVATKFKNAMQVFSGYDLFFEGVAQLKQGIQYVRDIDTALTELKKVTNETDEAYAQFLQTASKTAGVVGSTVKDITTMTADWSRLGYSMQEASALAESTAVLLNVSEFTDATDASEALISTIQAYGYAADESMDVVNVLNEVGKFIARR